MSSLTRSAPRPARWLLVLPALLLISGGVAVLSASPASAAPITVSQCNGVNAGTTGASTNLQCDVTIVNTISGGQRSSTTTVTRTCSLDPCAGGNGTFITNSPNLVTAVDQCNGSSNDAAHPTRCRVFITNNISADTPNAAPLAAATVNQCVGSAGGGGTTQTCNPPAATGLLAADIHQCNGSATGGGGFLTCTVATGANLSPALPMTIDQCNGTGNKGGNTVTCSVSLTTNITAAVLPTQSPTPSPTPSLPDETGNGVIGDVPVGGVATGGGSTAGLENQGWLALGGGLAATSILLLVLRRRTHSS